MSELAELALKEYQERNINFEPMYPAVLVRVLPKEKISASGLIYLPDERVNKPIFEGIVLRTYPPRRAKLDSGKYIWLESGLSVGDHICFPHWSGESVPFLPDKDNINSFEEYRAIPARGALSLAGMKDSGEPFLILNKEKESPKDKLLAFAKAVYASGYADGQSLDENATDLRHHVDKLLDDLDILVKIKSSMTRSGL